MVDDELGGRIRAARRARGMSLRALADRVGVSASMLSLLETGRSRSSVTTLYAVVEALGMSMTDLFADGGVPPRPGQPDSSEAPVSLIRRAQAPRVELETGVIWEQLGHKRLDGLEVLMVTYPPGAKSSLSGRFQQHTGFELAHVLQGELHCQVRFEEFTLAAGDSVSFDSARPHLFENQGPVEVRAVWVLLRTPAGKSSEVDREQAEDALGMLAVALGGKPRPQRTAPR
jgi:transcriptional regulator with XRE-family HTH domain